MKVTHSRAGPGGVVTHETTWLHRDALGSVRAITRLAAGVVEVIEKATYKPFGEQSE
ncbi:MAG: hypothetical protein WBP18_09865 [Paracoccaceae bacterium]